MKKLSSVIVILGISLFIFISCSKGGLGGKNTINVTVFHHEKAINGAMVYIKYDAEDFPGTDVALYDDSSSTLHDNETMFNELKKGNYYLYATGYDDELFENVSGGLPVKIKSKSGTHQKEVQVVE